METSTILSGILLNCVTIVQIGLTYLICSFLMKKPLGMQTLVDLVICHTLLVQSVNSVSYVALIHLAVVSSTPVDEHLAMVLTYLVNCVTLTMCFFYLFTVVVKVGKILKYNNF